MRVGGGRRRRSPSSGSRATAAPTSSCRRRFRRLGSPRSRRCAARQTSRRATAAASSRQSTGSRPTSPGSTTGLDFVNGYEADISAADYQHHDGDVLLVGPPLVGRADARAGGRRRLPGAVPARVGREEAARGRPRPARSGLRRDCQAARRRGRQRGWRRRATSCRRCRGRGFRARLEGSPGDPVVFELGLRDAERLLGDPSLARYRYEGLP